MQATIWLPSWGMATGVGSVLSIVEAKLPLAGRVPT